jgi:hypothetical protein
VPIAEHAGPRLIGVPAHGLAPDGRMLLVWGQGSELPADPVAQVRHRLVAVTSGDGAAWSEPYLVCPDIPASTLMGFPAVASGGGRWWTLAYLATEGRTDVVLLRGDRAGTSFTVARTLASRPLGADDVYFHAGYLAAHCSDVANLGDYMGLAAEGSRVAAAFVLPETDDPLSTPTLYVNVIEEA